MQLRSMLFFVALVPSLFGAPERPIISRIRHAEVSSSAIVSVGYSKRLHALEIAFRNGAIYRYFDVPVQIYRELLTAPSKASYYDANIRHHFHSAHVKAAASSATRGP